MGKFGEFGGAGGRAAEGPLQTPGDRAALAPAKMLVVLRELFLCIRLSAFLVSLAWDVSS